jgi:hypothetical protein
VVDEDPNRVALEKTFLLLHLWLWFCGYRFLEGHFGSIYPDMLKSFSEKGPKNVQKCPKSVQKCTKSAQKMY